MTIVLEALAFLEFAAFARRYADEEGSEKGPPERVDFFRAAPENLNLEG